MTTNAAPAHPLTTKPSVGRFRRLAALTVALAASIPSAALVDAAGAGTSERSSRGATAASIADYDGRRIDLSKSWDGAGACWVDEQGSATCFDTEREMDLALEKAGVDVARTNPATQAERDAGPESARAASCSSSLRLYRNSYYGSSVLYLSQRYYWINLSWYGFDNVVSSYRVGGCSATFRSGSNGTGSTYWGSTWAWASVSTMSGWDNVLSSVKIN